MFNRTGNPNLSWPQFEMMNDSKNRYFELMCRELFINEYVPSGVVLHSNPNNPGVEVEPVQSRFNKDGKPCYISFQAKYYKNGVDYSDIKESMEKAVKAYSGRLDLIYLYCNLDISTTSKSYLAIISILQKANIELRLVTNDSIFDQLLGHKDIAYYFFTDRSRGEKDFTTGRKYRIAISCPDEYKGIALGVIDQLNSYFDKSEMNYNTDHEAELIESKSGIALQNIYNNDSELFLVFYGNKYMDKTWRSTEYTAICSLINSDPVNLKRVVYIKCDDGCIPELDETTNTVIDAREKTTEEITKYVMDRYRFNKAIKGKVEYNILIYDDVQDQLDMLDQALFVAFKNETRYIVNVKCVKEIKDLYQYNREKDYDIYILDVAQRHDPSVPQTTILDQNYDQTMYDTLIADKPNPGIEAQYYFLSRLPTNIVIHEYIKAAHEKNVGFISKRTTSNAKVAEQIKDDLDKEYLCHHPE